MDVCRSLIGYDDPKTGAKKALLLGWMFRPIFVHSSSNPTREWAHFEMVASLEYLLIDFFVIHYPITMADTLSM